MVLTPIISSAATAEELMAQMQSMLLQLAALKNQARPVTVVPGNGAQANVSSNNSCPTLQRNLSRGMNGPDVQSLQKYLISLGILTAGSDSGIFGPRTESAVQKWQATYKVVATGTPASTGWGMVGARTRSMITTQCNAVKVVTCPAAPPPSSACSTGWRANVDVRGCTVSYRCSIAMPGRDLVSDAFSASPTSGLSPLLVTFTTKIPSSVSSLGVSYKIEYGDNSIEKISGCSSSGVCSLDSGVHVHSYTSPGRYSARLISSKIGACAAGAAVCAENQELMASATIVVEAR